MLRAVLVGMPARARPRTIAARIAIPLLSLVSNPHASTGITNAVKVQDCRFAPRVPLSGPPMLAFACTM